MRVRRIRQMRDAELRGQISAARVDLVHEVEALHVRLGRLRQIDGAGVVDQDVDAAELLRGLRDGCGELGIVADVAKDRQPLAAGFVDLLGRGVDRAWELGMRLGRLGGNGDVRPVARRPQGDGQADASAAAGDEEGLAR
jgi:hypothetical protein